MPVQDKYFEAGEAVFAEGDPSETAFIIERGRVEIHKVIDGSTVVLARLGDGEIFGEMGLVDERPRSAGATATEPTHLRTMGKKRFLELLRGQPEDSLAYVRALFERLRVMNSRVDPDYEMQESVDAGLSAQLRILPTNKATDAFLPAEGMVVEQVPFRVGRSNIGPLASNHLAVFDHQPYTVSRHHFVIERERDSYVICDRGSFLGTIVNGKQIGGKRRDGRAILQPGSNHVIAGDEHSRFVFDIQVPEN